MEKLFPEDGQELSQLNEDEFVERCPQVRFHFNTTYIQNIIMHE